MTTPIHTWFDGYLALRHRAFEALGAIELDTGERWPRTTGSHVMAIATAFTPALRASATPKVLRAWRTTVTDISLDGLPEPDTTYVHNRAFWQTLETVSLYLDDLAVPCPPQRAWNGLLGFLGVSPDAHRNVGPSGDGPFKHFDGVQTFDDLYNAQFKYLCDLRGFDRMKPDGGAPGAERQIPRTTNADVVALADYWTKQLADVKTVFGTESVTKTWRAATADVNALARGAEPSAVYAKNNAFWRALSTTAIHVAVADEAPSKWDLAKDAIKDSVLHLPDTLGAVASKGVEVIADTAHAAGHVVNEAGKGLFSGVGTPLLIGAGVLGAVLLLRGGRRQEEA